MESTANLELIEWRGNANSRPAGPAFFAAMLIGFAIVAALMAGAIPLHFSIVTVFLFAGPHNWFELRYFMMRLPARFGRSRTFFLTAFSGIGLLTIAYISMPVLFSLGVLTEASWSTVLASWNTMLMLWLGLLVWLRGKQTTRRDWFWAIPVALALSSLNWIAPEFFSLSIVYLHPIVALWFLDRHLKRNRPQWLTIYRRTLCLVPVLLVAMVWQLSIKPGLADDNGLFWRVTQHAGAQLLPNVSSHVLVAVHVFLEMLHYGVWLVALPLITRGPNRHHPSTTATKSGRAFDGIRKLLTVALSQHRRGFPRLICSALVLGMFLVAALWVGFAIDYNTTRDLYFTVAIAHVLAEAPFLLKML